jgi:hypothetical protein
MRDRPFSTGEPPVRTAGDTLTVELLIGRWPRLFHMAEAGTWPSIQQHGLRSTSALLDLFQITGAQRDRIESQRRPESIRISHPDHGAALIRDNKPINATVLARTLRGMTEAEWYRTLNARVFFWLTEARLNRLRLAKPYRDRQHDILVLDTQMLLGAHAMTVELSPINSGAVHGGAKTPRGAGTFQPIPQYPWRERRRISPAEPIVELTVPYIVTDITDLVIDIDTK